MWISLLCALSLSLNNGLGLTPPMGWMAWEQWRCAIDCKSQPDDCLSEKLFVQIIDHFVDDGFLEAGYEYVNIDDCWMGDGRDENGEMYADPERFPHGIAWLADYAHKKGVKLGIYNDFGTKTCEGKTGSEGHLVRDARTFAKWGVDMLKMDGCYSNILDQRDGYPGMSMFLNETGRPIMFSCSWPAYDMSMDYAPLPEFCNLWRNWYDIRSTWDSLLKVLTQWGDTPKWAEYAGPGHWNDPDMLIIGMKKNSWITPVGAAESRTQFAIWSILAAPLLMTNDLRVVPAWAKEILLNKEVIAVDQDKLGKQGKRISSHSDSASVWVRELENGCYAVALSNLGSWWATDITVTFSTFTTKSSFAIRDLYAHKDLGTFTGSFKVEKVPVHDAVILKLTPV